MNEELTLYDRFILLFEDISDQQLGDVLVENLGMIRIEHQEVNLDQLEERFGKKAEVSPQTLVEAGLIKNADRPVVVLGRGELKKALKVKAHRFSSSAREMIEAAGGTVEELPWQRGGYRTR